MGWKAVADKLDGLATVRHAVVTYSGSWAAPGVGYCSDVVNGLAGVNPDLCFEVPCDYPATFGPVNGPVTSPSYQQSVGDAVAWTAAWLSNNPRQTFALGGYSQGGECASRVLIELMGGSLKQYLPNFIGGYTFGNPCRAAGTHAPTIADPGGRGISPVNLTQLPTIAGQVVWADFVHSPNNGDAGVDMYASVPSDPAGRDMSDVYSSVTNIQFNDLVALAGDIVGTLERAVGDIITAPISAIEAAIAGLKFLAAPGGPTGPHISYAGEIPGYSNLVAHAVDWLHWIATLTLARSPN